MQSAYRIFGPPPRRPPIVNNKPEKNNVVRRLVCVLRYENMRWSHQTEQQLSNLWCVSVCVCMFETSPFPARWHCGTRTIFQNRPQTNWMNCIVSIPKSRCRACLLCLWVRTRLFAPCFGCRCRCGWYQGGIVSFTLCPDTVSAQRTKHNDYSHALHRLFSTKTLWIVKSGWARTYHFAKAYKSIRL